MILSGSRLSGVLWESVAQNMYGTHSLPWVKASPCIRSECR